MSIHIPEIDIWLNRPLTSWHHGERVDPKTWPWYVLFRFSHVRIEPNIGVRHKKIAEIGFCDKLACRPDRVPEHFENCRPRIYDRFYLYTRRRAYDIDVRVQ